MKLTISMIKDARELFQEIAEEGYNLRSSDLQNLFDVVVEFGATNYTVPDDAIDFYDVVDALSDEFEVEEDGYDSFYVYKK